ncbi:MAG: inosine-5-monophosphate dehydrogenase [Planctomyces sp.]|nr:inosine-5-monophosphate dehydrogenase [Planctomyces sp.]
MNIRDIMTSNVECIPIGSTLQEAAEKMRKLNVGSLPVCGENDKLAGMITDRDIVIRAVAEGRDCQSEVREFMTPRIEYCFEEDSIEEAAALMREKQIRRILVLNDDKHLVGVVALGDLAVKGQNDVLSGDALEDVSEPAMPQR